MLWIVGLEGHTIVTTGIGTHNVERAELHDRSLILKPSVANRNTIDNIAGIANWGVISVPVAPSVNTAIHIVNNEIKVQIPIAVDTFINPPASLACTTWLPRMIHR